GDDSAAHGEVPTITKEPSIPSLTPPTPLPQLPQDIPSTSQVQQAPPQSPQVKPSSPQPQPQQQAADFPMSLLQEAIDACAALTRRLEHLEYDKVAQALEITKVDTSDDTVMDDESNLGRMIAEMDQDDTVVLKDDKEEDKEVADKDVKEAKVGESAQVQGRQAESQVKIYKIHMVYANKVLSMHEDETEPAENVAGFKMDYFKGISYDDIRPIFEAKFNLNVSFLLKTKEQIKEEENRGLHKLNETLAERATKRRKLDEELILLVERKYPLTRFTLDQMLNAVRLKVKEESEVSLDLLRKICQVFNAAGEELNAGGEELNAAKKS
nr:hypothetical protein [Tanacetum cinerariifolium]